MDREDAAWPVVLSSVLLSGAVAAAVSAAMLRLAYDAPPAVGGVRLAEIAASYAVEAAESEAPAANARVWAAALETALDRVAMRRGAVLLPARAVAAGAPDVTNEVEAVLAQLLASRPPDGDGAPPGGTP